MNIKKINRAKRIAKARNIRRNNYSKVLPIPMLGNYGWANYRSYLEGFKR